jgi:hypothetical protein
MRVTVHGLQQAQAAMDKAMSKVENGSEMLVTAVLMGVAANTVPYVPVDTATLINSDVRRVQKTGRGATGFLAYGATSGIGANGTPVSEYSVYVHEGPQRNWQKPGASNRFLAKGVRDFLRYDLQGVLARFDI